MKFFLLYLDYIISGNKTKARLFGRDLKGRLVKEYVDFTPSFYVLYQDKEKNRALFEIKDILKKKNKRIDSMDVVEKKINGKMRKFIKINCFLPPDTQKIRDIVKLLEKKRGGSGSVIQEYQYSLSFSDSFLLENKIYNPGWIELKKEKVYQGNLQQIPDFKILAFDIEINIEKENNEKKIIMISYFSNNFKKVTTYRKKGKYQSFVKLVKDEKELLLDFLE